MRSVGEHNRGQSQPFGHTNVCLRNVLSGQLLFVTRKSGSQIEIKCENRIIYSFYFSNILQNILYIRNICARV